jgi:hypothetical protein
MVTGGMYRRRVPAHRESRDVSKSGERRSIARNASADRSSNASVEPVSENVPPDGEFDAEEVQAHVAAEGELGPPATTEKAQPPIFSACARTLRFTNREADRITHPK